MELDYNRLSVSTDGRTVHISAEITNDTGESAFIRSISIDTSDTFVELLEKPSSNAVTQEFNSTAATWDCTDDSFAGKLLFVWVEVGNGDSDSSEYRIAAIVNWYSLYCTAMQYVKGMNCNGCNPPMDFIDFILRTKGIDYALQTGNYLQAVKLWNGLSAREAKNLSGSSCGCN